MSKRTAKRWAQIGPPIKQKEDPFGKNIKRTPVDLKGTIQNPLEEKYDYKTIQHTVEDKHHGRSFVDLAVEYLGLTPGKARFLILKGEITVTGSAHARFVDQDPKCVLHSGDVIERVARFAKPVKTLEEAVQRIRASILYEDERILIINKKHGMPVHDGSKNAEFHLEQLLEELDLKEKPRLVHRLDKDTTGCLMIAKTKEAAQELSLKFQDPTVPITRKYFGVLVPPLDSTRYPVGSKHEWVSGLTTVIVDGREKQRVVPWHDDYARQDGEIKKAVTKVEILQSNKKMTVVALEPVTGRKHQLRVQCIKHTGSFLLGDQKYASGYTKVILHNYRPKADAPLFLHLSQLQIRDWYGKDKHLIVNAPLNDFWRKLIMSVGMNTSVVHHFKQNPYCHDDPK
ncbi:pseudouridine synthase [Gorgonomyces haynaldii]|nr:pseudouridine synthase [Gorgonomyces haynaldii]